MHIYLKNIPAVPNFIPIPSETIVFLKNVAIQEQEEEEQDE